jgi:hypothetical protein
MQQIVQEEEESTQIEMDKSLSPFAGQSKF